MAAEHRSDSATDVVVSTLEVAPYVGQLLGALARFALSQDEEQAVESCLRRALRIDGLTPKGINKWNPFKRAGKQAWNAACELAATDLLAQADMLGERSERAKTIEPDGSDERGAMAPASTGVPVPSPGAVSALSDPQRLIDAMNNLLGDPADLDAGVPWSLRISASFKFTAEDHVAAISKRSTTPPANESKDAVKKREDQEKKDLSYLQLVANEQIEGIPAALKTLEDLSKFDAFSRRVGRRFEANLAADPSLRYLVARLDHADEQHAQLALIATVRRISVCLVILGMAAVPLAALALGVDITDIVDVLKELNL